MRPPPGWRTDHAILSAYSAEPTVVVALLLALAGRDDDGGSGSQVALARALHDLHGRVTFLVQRGRIAAPRKTPRVLALLDRFICEIPLNEGETAGVPGQSWHAKLALVRMVPNEDNEAPAQWRFWLGSRNFTSDNSWDIGLSLESVLSGSSAGQTIPGIEQVAERLAQTGRAAAAWQPLLSELAQTKWNVPRGLKVRRIALMLPQDTERGLPEAPTGVSHLFAVAPFLDGETVRRLGGWTDQARELLSSTSELVRLAIQAGKPLEQFELLTLPGAPEEGEASPEEDAASLDASLDARGLHAKFLWAEHIGGATLLLGSPNLTARAWKRNAEAFAEVSVRLRGGARAARFLYEGIESFRQIARPVRLEDLGDSGPEDSDLKDLEIARCQVAARLSGHQRRSKSGITTVEVFDQPPHPDDPRVSLAVGRLGETLLLWPRDAMRVTLPEGDGSPDSDLISVRVSLKDQALSWTQVVPFDPRLPTSRDTDLLRDYLGARGVLSWIRDVLDDAIENRWRWPLGRGYRASPRASDQGKPEGPRLADGRASFACMGA